uniref:Uncharacterized protein n=1 Tax=Oryza brachyantha TaxID=4533 RepID=J3MJM7_ORYBR
MATRSPAAASLLLLLLFLVLAVHGVSGRGRGHGRRHHRPGMQTSQLPSSGTFISYQGLFADGAPGRRGFQRIGPAANRYSRGCLAMERCRDAKS